MTYSIKITRINGRMSTLKDVESHSVILNGLVMDIVLKDRRRFLIPIDGHEFEFSKELSKTIEDRKIIEDRKRTAAGG